MGKGHGIEFPKAISATKVVPQFRILVPEDPAIAQFKLAGKQGTDSEFGSSADDGKGGRFDADFAGAFALPPPPDGEALGPAEVFPVVGMDEHGLAVVGGGGLGMGVQAESFKAFWRLRRSRVRRCKG